MKQVLLADLVDMNNPEAILRETRLILESALPGFDFTPVELAFHDTVRLYKGIYPGYRACNTDYHDLKHTTDCLLAQIRLLHGAIIEKTAPGEDTIRDGLMAALFHDTGYIQRADESSEGTGARFTKIHVGRSADFAIEYGRQRGFPHARGESMKTMILCTDLAVDINKIPFSSPDTRLVGQMLGTSDLVGQMADRTYLEKLLFLYREFREGGVPGYEAEVDILKKTRSFFDLAIKRMDEALEKTRRLLPSHFRERWNIDTDLYDLAIKHNMEYLETLVNMTDYRAGLRRDGLTKALEEKERMERLMNEG